MATHAGLIILETYVPQGDNMYIFSYVICFFFGGGGGGGRSMLCLKFIRNT